MTRIESHARQTTDRTMIDESERRHYYVYTCFHPRVLPISLSFSSRRSTRTIAGRRVELLINNNNNVARVNAARAARRVAALRPGFSSPHPGRWSRFHHLVRLLLWSTSSAIEWEDRTRSPETKFQSLLHPGAIRRVIKLYATRVDPDPPPYIGKGLEPNRRIIAWNCRVRGGMRRIPSDERASLQREQQRPRLGRTHPRAGVYFRLLLAARVSRGKLSRNAKSRLPRGSSTSETMGNALRTRMRLRDNFRNVISLCSP